MDCIDNKIHVFCEKPISYKIKEIENLIRESKNKGTKFACAPATPLNPSIAKAKELLKVGVIGRPCYAVGCFSNAGPASLGYNISYYENIIKEQKLHGFKEISTDHTGFYKNGMGVIEDTGVYMVTTLVFLLGSVKYMQCLSGTQIPVVQIMGGIACGKKVNVEIDDCTLILFEFSNGSYASMSSSYCVKGSKMPELEIYGTDGTISIPSVGSSKLEVYLEQNSGFAGWNKPYEDLSGWKMGIGVEHLAECILENKEPVINANLAKHVTEILLKVRQASSLGEKIPLESKI
ncbi:MAG: Gfo/Idh/MocA family oxidoreductase [Actinobacteria bacterium]|nr:Gfo/Idh/MocA family oxidoreductase [Actinomycetota bacterium]